MVYYATHSQLFNVACFFFLNLLCPQAHSCSQLFNLQQQHAAGIEKLGILAWEQGYIFRACVEKIGEPGAEAVTHTHTQHNKYIILMTLSSVFFSLNHVYNIAVNPCGCGLGEPFHARCGHVS